jgi:hypothetical protein
VLHVRHARSRAAGAILATAAGTTAVAVGVAASATDDLALAGALVLGMWWWTIGKMWVETRVMPRLFGLTTMVLAVVALAAAVVVAATGYAPSATWTSERLALGAWTLGLAAALARTRSS